MEESLSAVVGALAIGAAALTKGAASDSTRKVYETLRACVIKEFDADKAVRALETDPDSTSNQAALIEAIAARTARVDDKLSKLGRDVLRSATADVLASHRDIDASIRVGRIHGSVGAIVQRLRASGQISLDEVTADRGEVRVSDLSAGTDIDVRLQQAPNGTSEGSIRAGRSRGSSSTFSDFSAGRDIVLNLSGTATASKFSGKIQAFLEEYLVAETGTGKVPFGGRNRELKALDRWLSDPKSPARLVLVGPAGRGKSALLVNWVMKLTDAHQDGEADAWNVVFVPISIRFGTNRPAIFYEAIAARLAEVLEVDLRPPQAEPGTYFEDQCRRLARTAIERGRRFLIVIDGADEAMGSSFEASWFPRRGEGVLRLVVSARLQIGDVDGSGWVRRLGWETGVRCQTLELPGLDVAGVKNLLATSGAPVDYLSARPDIVEKLHKLSEGEPLILRLYVEDLWLRGEGTQELTVQDLVRIKPGLSGYFEDWLRRQQEVWREDRKGGASIDSAVIGVQLALLACAHGPLSSRDIGQLLELCGCRNDGLRIEDGLHPLRRFVIGGGRRLDDDSSGYVLSHPRFGQFLREDYLDQSRVAEARAALARWGTGIVRRANEGAIPPDQVSRYVVGYHCQHLLDAEITSDSFMEMIEPGWLRTCEVQEGGYWGFSEAVKAAMDALLREKPSHWRSSLIRCALFQTSVVSTVSQIPEEVVLPSVRGGLMPVRQVLHWLEFHPQEVRFRVLVQLSALLDGVHMAAALEACRSLGSHILRARALSALIPRLSIEDRSTVAAEALFTLGQLHDSWRDSLYHNPLRRPENSQLVGDTLAEITKYLDVTDMSRAATIAGALPYGSNRVQTFLAMAHVMQGEDRTTVLRQALSALSGVRQHSRFREFIGALIPHVTLDLLPPFFDALCVEDPSAAEGEHGVADLIDELMPKLSVRRRTLAFEAATRLAGRGLRYKVAARILRHVPKDQHTLVLLTSLATAADGGEYSRLAAGLAEFFTPELIGIVIKHAQLSFGDSAASTVIGQMAPALSKEVADRALIHAIDLKHPAAQLAALLALAPHVSIGGGNQIWDVALRLQHDGDRGKLFIGLIPWLAESALDDAGRAIARLSDPSQRVDGLLLAGSRRTGEPRSAMIRQAIEVTSGISNRYESVIACFIAISECEPAHRVPLALDCLSLCISLGQTGDFLQVLLNVELEVVFGDFASPADAQIELQTAQFEVLSRDVLRRLTSCTRAGQLAVALQASKCVARWMPRSLLPDLLSVAAVLLKESSAPEWHLAAYADVLVTVSSRLPDEAREEVLSPLLKALEEQGDYYISQTSVYATLVPYLSGEWARSWIDKLFFANEKSQASILTDLNALLPEVDRGPRLETALRSIKSAARVNWQESWPATFKRVLPMLPGNPVLADEFLGIAAELTLSAPGGLPIDWMDRIPTDRRTRMLALALDSVGVATALTAVDANGESVLGLVASAASQMRDPSQRAILLSALARRSSDEQKKTLASAAVQAAFAVPDRTERARLLAGVVDDLPAQDGKRVLNEAFRLSKAIDDDAVQFKVLAALSEHVSEEFASELGSRAVGRLASLEGPEGRAMLLRAVSGVLSGSKYLSLVDEELASAQSGGGGWHRTSAWSALAPLLSEDQLIQAWRLASRVDDAEAMLATIASLAPHVPQGAVDELFSQRHGLSSSIREALTVVLAPYVSLMGVEELVADLAEMRDHAKRARALLSIGLRLTGAKRQALVREAIDLSRNSDDVVTFARSLIAAIGDDRPVDTAAVRAALDVVLRIPLSMLQDKIAVLRELMPHLTAQMIPVALQDAPSGEVVLALLPRLSDDLVRDLVPWLEDPFYEDPLYIPPMDLIATLGPALPADLHDKAFVALLKWREDVPRIRAVAKFIPHVNEQQRTDSFVDLAECATRVKREVILEVIPDFAPFVLASEGTGGVERLGRALLEVGECFA